MPLPSSSSAPPSAVIIAIHFDSKVSSECCMVCLFRSCHVIHAAWLMKLNVSMHYSSEQGTVSDGPCLLIVLTTHALVDASVNNSNAVRLQRSQSTLNPLHYALRVEPFNRALKTLQCDVMINGRRRDHGAERAHLDLLEAGAPVKCNPLAWWEFKDCWDYIDQQKLQYHPLHDEVS